MKKYHKLCIILNTHLLDECKDRNQEPKAWKEIRREIRYIYTPNQSLKRTFYIRELHIIQFNVLYEPLYSNSRSCRQTQHIW